jgi:hypothetical protein
VIVHIFAHSNTVGMPMRGLATEASWSSLLVLVVACQAEPPRCPATGTHTLFSANFETAPVGAPPPPGGALLYGPPGAEIRITDAVNNVTVVNSAALGSRAVQLTRVMRPTTVEFLFGDPGETPCCGTYVISFRAVGLPVPQYLISGTGIAVMSMESRYALLLRLFGDEYHHRQGDLYVPLSGSYDPAQPHNVRLGVNLDADTYTVCVNDVVIAAEQPFMDAEFHLRRSLSIRMSATITENFAAGFIIDDVRVTK